MNTAAKCHSANMFSRRRQPEKYINPINEILSSPTSDPFMRGLYFRPSRHIDFKYASRPFLDFGAVPDACILDVNSGMQFVSKEQATLALGAKLRTAEAPTPGLVAEILDISRRRALIPGHMAKAQHLERLIDAGAWVDAALALLELELPLWHIRRLAHDSGEWYCALSRHRELPDWLDQSIEARHPDLALVIMSAFIEAQAAAALFGGTSPHASCGRPDSDFISLCCDNFG